MLIAGIILLAIVMGVVIYLATLDGRFEVKQSIMIECDAQTIFDKITDFKTWHEWSPWLIHEPSTKLDFSDNVREEGGWYRWDGERIGAGRLSHVEFNELSRIDQALEFTRPWKSHAQVSWDIKAINGTTEVTWGMSSSMPFFLRFMVPLTQKMIEKDYALGLARLNGVLNPQVEYPEIRFAGKSEFAAQRCLTIAFDGHLDDIINAMQEGFPRLTNAVQAQEKAMLAPPFAAYRKMDPKIMRFAGDMAAPVDAETEVGDLDEKLIGGGVYYKTELKGDYRFLELAWYAAFTHLRMEKLALDRSRPSLEVYEVDPETVSHSNEVLTSIYIPIKK